MEIKEANLGLDISKMACDEDSSISFYTAEIETGKNGKLPIDPKFLNDYIAKTDTQQINLIRVKKKKWLMKINDFVKRLFDIIFSVVLIVLLSPLLLVLLFIDGFSIHGNPIYSHKRLGYRGKVFKLYKFQSMKNDHRPLEKILTKEQLKQLETEFKIENDPRITRFGRFIRKTSLDELPQLFNVLFGSMSFIGPRPVIDMEIELYYKDRKDTFLSIKPGITGYWQSYGRNNICYQTGERQNMELYYISHRSLWFDVKILFKTVIAVIKKDGAQ
jgi:lipopolysaccharide/colanic/teichoic acid biosynthesis glycosyltransferase